MDVLVGSGSTTIQPREVVTDAHCNQCHTDIVGHGGRRKGVGLCVLCHTSGSEDKNDAMIEGGTPGVSVDFRVMIHKIHNGHHLPSVLGVTTKLDGTGDRDYLAPPKPYKLVGFNVLDASEIGFPVFPSLNTSMPRDFGYTALTQRGEGARGRDAPGRGGLRQVPRRSRRRPVPSRRRRRATCTSSSPRATPAAPATTTSSGPQPYKANNAIMPANPGTCTGCHPASGVGAWPIREGHTHPLVDPVFNPGLAFNVSAVSEAASRAWTTTATAPSTRARRCR